jgi:hypothetical protein
VKSQIEERLLNRAPECYNLARPFGPFCCAGSAILPGPVLYSVNPFYSIEVARRYRNNNFYAWCSEVFSVGQQAGAAPGGAVAASSDPMTIYEQLHRATTSEDRHDKRILSYKRAFKRLAASWLDANEITQDQHDEIRAACGQPSWRMWRPLLYIIPRNPIEAAGRLQLVPVGKRAGPGTEYIIADLRPQEFDIVELPMLRDRA